MDWIFLYKDAQNRAAGNKETAVRFPDRERRILLRFQGRGDSACQLFLKFGRISGMNPGNIAILADNHGVGNSVDCVGLAHRHIKIKCDRRVFPVPFLKELIHKNRAFRLVDCAKHHF